MMILTRKQKKDNLEKGVKFCSKCSKKVPLEGFYKNAYYWDGFSVYCKGCQNALSKKSYDANRDSRLAKMREYHKTKNENKT